MPKQPNKASSWSLFLQIFFPIQFINLGLGHQQQGQGQLVGMPSRISPAHQQQLLIQRPTPPQTPGGGGGRITPIISSSTSSLMMQQPGPVYTFVQQSQSGPAAVNYQMLNMSGRPQPQQLTQSQAQLQHHHVQFSRPRFSEFIWIKKEEKSFFCHRKMFYGINKIFVIEKCSMA